jgi:preprotein translocase subunit SecG
MSTVIVVIHLLLAVALVTVILLQKSEGGALGIGGGGGMSGFMTGRSTANLLTRTTAILAACFFATSIALAIVAARSRAPSSVIDQPATTQSAPATPTTPAKPATPPVPAAPTGPSAPLTK